MTLTADHDDIAEHAAPYRRELLAHCYRMLGSMHDAEDAVQETMVRAWQGRAGFQGRASLRVWLYRIATNVCLRGLERRERLPMPSALGAPSREPDVLPVRSPPEVRWLEPAPDALLLGGGTPAGGVVDPAAVVALRAGVRLAFISALQLLPARQRAALILRDVLAFSAQETAEVLQTSTAAVNSALQRARAQIAGAGLEEDEVLEPSEPAVREQLGRYLQAFEDADVNALLRLLRDDVVLEMPPMAAWFRGRADAGRFLGTYVLSKPGQFRNVPIGVNLQTGFAAYQLEDDGMLHAHAINAITVTRRGISRIDAFLDAELFPVFGLPLVLPPDAMNSRRAADQHL
ncbi:sigma-70 family RNA polymerase sigma factor [Catenulispora yoronensis]|uniref:Sigma-70 family RNA polymerase sigma factor n=1 Tax=Catenulispora yoronensis TaxID=450799 RepID=A0ABP5GQ42_9ACTN